MYGLHVDVIAFYCTAEQCLAVHGMLTKLIFNSIVKKAYDKVTILYTVFQVIDLYWGVEADEWDSPELQKTRMKLLEDCLKSSAGPCFVVGIKITFYFTTKI